MWLRPKRQPPTLKQADMKGLFEQLFVARMNFYTRYFYEAKEHLHVLQPTRANVSICVQQLLDQIHW